MKSAYTCENLLLGFTCKDSTHSHNYCWVASSNMCYYFKNKLFDKRSKYISIKNPLHKQSINACMCFQTRRVRTHDFTVTNGWIFHFCLDAHVNRKTLIAIALYFSHVMLNMSFQTFNSDHVIFLFMLSFMNHKQCCSSRVKTLKPKSCSMYLCCYI